ASAFDALRGAPASEVTLLGRGRAVHRSLRAVPEGVDRRRAAGFLDATGLLGGEYEVDRGEVRCQLRLAARAEHERVDARAIAHPGQRHLRDGAAAFVRHVAHGVDDTVQAL